MNFKKRGQGSMNPSGSIIPVGEALAPLVEGPAPENCADEGKKESSWASMRNWMKAQLEPLVGQKRSDPRLLLGVLGCPLAPVDVSAEPLPHLSIKGIPIETSSAQYIVQQYIAASGASKFENKIKNSYTMGKVRMFTSEFETATKIVKHPLKAAENGWFVLWQMMPDKWYLELAIEDSSVHAGSNGNLVWRYTSWLGAHAAKGPVRPPRRVLQGLDPMSTARMFMKSHCMGEKKIKEEDCFILKLTADPSILAARSDGSTDIIRHVLFGYFSQKTGLLVCLEDTHLTRIETTGAEAVYWETTIESSLEDYRLVDGLTIAHAGHSVVTLFRFGEVAMSHTRTRMEEIWTIKEVAFNVPGLSTDCFIPPADIRKENVQEASLFSQEKDKSFSFYQIDQSQKL